MKWTNTLFLSSTAAVTLKRDGGLNLCDVVVEHYEVFIGYDEPPTLKTHPRTYAIGSF